MKLKDIIEELSNLHGLKLGTDIAVVVTNSDQEILVKSEKNQDFGIYTLKETFNIMNEIRNVKENKEQYIIEIIMGGEKNDAAA